MRIFSRIRKGLTGATGKSLLKLIIYAGACLAVLAYLISLIGNIKFFEHYHHYTAKMPDVTGLLPNDAVKVAGVQVGKVTGISYDRGLAKVDFEVKTDLPLRKGTQVEMRWRNLLGQKYLYVLPSKSGPELKSGSTIGPKRVITAADVGDFLNSVGPFLQAINPDQANTFVRNLDEALSGNDARINELVSNGAKIADTVGGLDTKVGNVVGNLDQILAALAARNQDLSDTITNLRDLGGKLGARKQSLVELTDQVRQMGEQVDALLTRNEGNLDSTVQNLRTITNVLAQHHDDLETALATLPNGTLPYFEISRYGQWFRFRAIYTCTFAEYPGAPGQCAGANALSGGAPNQGGGSASATAGPAADDRVPLSALFAGALGGGE